jgi:hypothetical protein
MGDWSLQRIEQLAPDAASFKTGQGLAKPAKWQNLGHNDRLIWGECQGSGANPYQVRVDVDDVAYKCTCPSRKLPCKHTLALLLLLTGSALPAGNPPAFVEEWSANRAKRAEAKQTRETTPAAPADPQAKARRIEKRETRIAGGLEQLETWLADIARQGLAAARAQPPTFWSQMAARLVDAQVPGLARRVGDLGTLALTSADWQSRLLAGIARLQLLIDAYRNLEQLPDALAADVRTLAGWTQEQEALREREGVRDRWQVLGRAQTQDDQLRVQRTWLHGEGSKRMALILEFAVGNQPLAATFTLGQSLDAELVFFESATPLRAIEKIRHGALPAKYSLPDCSTVAALQASHAGRLAANPWLSQWPVAVGPVAPVLHTDRLWLQDDERREIPVVASFRHAWHAIALAGADRLRIFGVWEGDALEPLTLECRGAMFSVARLGELAVLSRVA